MLSLELTRALRAAVDLILKGLGGALMIAWVVILRVLRRSC